MSYFNLTINRFLSPFRNQIQPGNWVKAFYVLVININNLNFTLCLLILLLLLILTVSFFQSFLLPHSSANELRIYTPKELAIINSEAIVKFNVKPSQAREYLVSKKVIQVWKKNRLNFIAFVYSWNVRFNC